MNTRARRLCLLLALAAPSAASSSADAERGAELHAEHCTRCHDSARYTSADRSIDSFAALRERVQLCELAAELAWFEEEVDDVTAWLNREFYHFTNATDK